MSEIRKVLAQLPNLEVMSEEQDINKYEITFRADSTWITILERITRVFPELYFCKRYFSEGGQFGYRWSIIRFGNLAPENINEIAQKLEYAIFQMSAPSKQPVVVNKKAHKNNHNVRKQKLEIGDEILFPMSNIEGELNPPRENGGGAYLRNTKEMKNLQARWGARSL